MDEPEFPPYDERDSRQVEADEVPADSFDEASADFEAEGDPDGCA
jgi:hypothetical protein